MGGKKEKREYAGRPDPEKKEKKNEGK